MSRVTLDEVKHHLRYDDDSNDTNLTMYLKGAEAAVNNYINMPEKAEGADDVKVAVLLLVGYYDDHRNVDKDMVQNGNYLPPPVQNLLYPYRKPTAV